MSNRLLQILASLAQRRALRTLNTICETQHQISTRKLGQYLEPIGDELAGHAFHLRIEYDALTSKVAELESELAELREECERLRGECARLESKYERDVWGLNNEGDPIGGDHPSGFANDLLRVTIERDTLRQQRDKLAGLLRLSNNNEIIPDDLGERIELALAEVKS